MNDLKRNLYQYYCPKCGYKRPGLLDSPAGIGGYSTDCPECGSHYFSKKVDGQTENQPTHPADGPVAWVNVRGFRIPGDVVSPYQYSKMEEWERKNYSPLYTRHQPGAWVGLTDRERDRCWRTLGEGEGFPEYAEAIEALLKEKNSPK